MDLTVGLLCASRISFVFTQGPKKLLAVMLEASLSSVTKKLIMCDSLVPKQVGNTADALFDFEEAAELDPDNSGYHSDLGVIRMRLGLLDEALGSFQTADELEPGSELAAENLKALQEHMDWRERNGIPDDRPAAAEL